MSSRKKYDIKKARETFFAESAEMLGSMEACLLNIEKDFNDMDSINALFRAVHTIKGSSGMFNLGEIERFTHIIENILDGIRNGIGVIDGTLISILLECHDYIKLLLETFEREESAVLSSDLINARDDLTSRLNRYDPAGSPPVSPLRAGSGGRPEPSENSPDGLHVSSDHWHISLRFGKDVFRNGLDPQSFITYLGGKGQIINIAAIADALPCLADMDPESCYLGFEIAYQGAVDKRAIEDVFEFMKDDCELRILPPQSGIGEYVNLINNLNEPPMRIGDILMKVGSLTEGELRVALARQAALSGGGPGTEAQPLLGRIMVEDKMVHKPVLDAALEKQAALLKAEEHRCRSIRIDSEKLDELINIVGELVITGAAVKQASESCGESTLLQSVLTMSRLVEDVRDKIMNIRMVQIGDTFTRFERIVRDLSRETGKEVDFIINGGDTELDKTLIEKITDPILHLIRNSLDHGIDEPDERERRGKPRRGSLRLNAYHETGSVVIEVADDGSGLDRDGIYGKAVELGYIQPDQAISDNELFQLIFEPGFSTARKVTNISGRGVGMDVVKRNIEALRGSVILESGEGAGTTVRIHMPLTLAIIDGFMVQVRGSYYVIPLDMVREVFEITGDELAGREGANIINLRGEVLPFMRLCEFFGANEEAPGTEFVVVVEYARKRAGLLVEALIGEFQTVIKPLGRLFSGLQWVSGATILGTGDVALILDVPRLIQSGRLAQTGAA